MQRSNLHLSKKHARTPRRDRRRDAKKTPQTNERVVERARVPTQAGPPEEER